MIVHVQQQLFEHIEMDEEEQWMRVRYLPRWVLV